MTCLHVFSLKPKAPARSRPAVKQGKKRKA
jgi:hypothetical protein